MLGSRDELVEARRVQNDDEWMYQLEAAEQEDSLAAYPSPSSPTRGGGIISRLSGAHGLGQGGEGLEGRQRLCPPVPPGGVAGGVNYGRGL